MEKHYFSYEDIQKINNYRSELGLSAEKYSDEDVWEVIETTRWLARLYVRQFKQASPEDLLKSVELEYNIHADTKS